VVVDSVLMENVHVGKDALVQYAMLDEGTVVSTGAKLGEPRALGGKVTVVSRGSIIEKEEG